MRLGIQMLNNSSSLNNLIVQNQTQINPGESTTVYFQLVDLDQKNGNCPAPRYIPAAGAIVQIQLTSVDTAKNIIKFATQPFPQDTSIFSFNLSASETQYGAGVNMKVTLNESGNIKIGIAESAIIFGPKSPYSC